MAMVTYGNTGAKFSYTKTESSMDAPAKYTTLVQIRLPHRFPIVRITAASLWARLKDKIMGASDIQLGEAALDEAWNIQGHPVGWARLVLRASALTAHPVLLQSLRELYLEGHELQLKYNRWILLHDDIRERMEAIQHFIDSVTGYLEQPKSLFKSHGFSLTNCTISRGFHFERVEEAKTFVDLRSYARRLTATFNAETEDSKPTSPLTPSP